MTTNDTGQAHAGLETSAAPGIDQLVTEEQIAQMTGLEVSQVRLMISGNAPIPPHLEGVIPQPARQFTGYVWRPEDVVGLQDRIAAALERAEQQNILAAQQEEAAAAAVAPAPETAPEDRDIHAARKRRDAERKQAQETFRLDHDDYAEAAMPVGKKEKLPWWKAIASSWGEGRDVTGHTKPAPRAERPSRRPARAVTVDDTSADTSFDELLNPQVPDALLPISTPVSNTRRATRSTDRDVLATEKADLKAQRAREKHERAQEMQNARERRAAEKAAKREEAVAARAQATISKATAPQVTAEERAAAKRAAAEEKARLKAEAREAKAGVAAAGKAASRGNSEARQANVAADKQARLDAAEEKRQNKLASKEAKIARQRRYREALERWREDVRIAKQTGTAPPKKPKAPKNDTSKPKPIDVTNSVRAFATMLENSPGELDSIQVMVKEYEGTQLGEAFRRIEFRISDQNATLVEAFAPEKIFPVEVHNMLAVGAKTIAPGPALRTAVKLMDAASDGKRKLRSEIMEPIAVGSLSLVALFATAYAVMPTFVTMYESLEMPVPPVSAAILVMSDVVVWVLGIAAVLGISYVAWWFLYGRTWNKWRTALDAYSLHMPLMGKANQATETLQLLKVLHAYMRVGSPEREAIVDAAEATKNRAIKKHLLTVASLMMDGRRTFAGVFDSDMFPNMARNIVGIGEKAGRVTESIGQLEEVYEREAEVESQQAITRVSGTVAGISSMIFTIVVTMVTVPPLEMFGSTLSYGQ